MLGAAIRDWTIYNEGKKLFDACNFKGTFANCKSECCIGCHKDTVRKDLSYIARNSIQIRRKLGVLFGTCCPACYSKNFKVNFMLRHGCNKCGDCGHMWGQ